MFMFFWILLFLGILLLILLERYYRSPYLSVRCTLHDRIAIDQCVLVLHAYAQWKIGRPITFKSAVTETRFFEVNKHYAKPAVLIRGWTFYPFYGTTGMQNQTKGYLSHRSLLGFVVWHKQKRLITIVFRNARTLKDLTSFFVLRFEKNPLFPYKGYLHTGCINVFKTCVKEITQLLNTITTRVQNISTYRLVITGHSLGGGLATLMAVYMVGHELYTTHWQPRNLHLITFGAPYVGAKCPSHDFATWSQQHIGYIKCFERSTDLSPFATQLSRFQLKKKLRFIENPMRLKPISPTPSTILYHFNDSRFRVRRAHDIERYREAIYNALHIPYQKVYQS